MSESMSSDLPPTFVDGFHDEAAVRKMGYNKFGSTDMVVSRLAMGCSPFGDVYQGKEFQAEDVIAITTEAVRLGVNFLDTAFWYGQGKSEQLLGKALMKLPRQSYYLATKVGRYYKEYEKMFDFSAAAVTKSVDDSLERLGIDYIDLIQIHDLEFAPDDSIVINETLPALQKLKESGKVRYIGITSYSLDALKYTLFNNSCRGIIDKIKISIDSVLSYCRGTLFDSALDDYCQYLKSKGVGVINASPVAMGLLTPQGPPDWHPASQELKNSCQEAVKYCQDEDVDICRLALKYSMHCKGVSTTLLGMGNLEILKSSIETATQDFSKTERDLVDRIRYRYFGKCRNNWEGVELDRYWTALGGKPASSME